MMLNKGKNKGKVHPSPSSSSSPSSFSFSSSSNSTDPISALNILLPAAILTLISALSLSDREVFAYMISRSLKSPPSFIAPPITTKRKSKKSSPSFSSSSSSSCCLSSSAQHQTQKSPAFDCDCFGCYTAYWVRWDSSPHRELIHQAIEAFEEHLASSELLLPKKKERSRSRKDKDPKSRQITQEQKVVIEENEEKSAVNESLPEEVATAISDVKEADVSGGHQEIEEKEEEEQQQKQQVQQQHKGLARKVLPDVIGLFNSRLWNLWGPNV